MKKKEQVVSKCVSNPFFRDIFDIGLFGHHL